VNISNVVIKTEAMSEWRRYLKWRILTLAAGPRCHGSVFFKWVRRDEGAGGKRRRIGEVELVAVRVRDDHEPVAPLPVLHIHAAPFQLRAQGIQHADIERDEHQALAHFIGPLRRENELAALPVDLRDPRFPLLLISPRLREPELLHIKIDGPPGFTIAAVAALALGIGANTAIFSVVNTVLLKPLTYPNADRMVDFLAPSSGLANNLHCIPEFHFFERQTNLFKEVVAYDNAGPGFNLTGGRPEQVHGIHVTEGYFRVYGAPVVLGRTFTPQEDSPHGGKVVVLSYGLWQRRFGGDQAIVGKSLSLGNEPYTIVGVIGKDFVADPQADLWLPFQFDPASTDMNLFFEVTGLLQPGVTVAQANAELRAASPEYHREFPNTDWRPYFTVGPLRDSIIGDARNSLLMMLGAVGLVLLISCANVANLLLVRATVRKREFAIRSALGAGRARIVRQLLTESVLLSLAGGILGMALGFQACEPARRQSRRPASHRRGRLCHRHGLARARLHPRCLAAYRHLFGLFPAFSASRSDLNSTLKESGNRSGTGFREGKARSLLVVSEISLALVLLIGAALLIRTFIALHEVGPGFDAHNVLTMEMSLNGQRYQNTAGIAQLLRDGRDRLNALPGVELAAAGFWLPIDVEDGTGFQIVGRPVEKTAAEASG
jgi:putative ABC transport system permease protein